MAIIRQGINGGFSGKAGTVVGYYRLGKWVMRGLPRPSSKNKRGTEEQKASRSKFAKMQHALSPVVPFIRVGFNMEARSRQLTTHNVAKSHNMLHAFSPDGEVDFSKLLLSNGSLLGPLNPTVETDDVGLHFSWTNNSAEEEADSRDQVMLLAYDHLNVDQTNKPNPKAFFTLSGARRKAGMETLEIPSHFKGHALHTYIAFISDDREHISMSSYVGEIVY
jgi:hypothetical protein